jgi:threonine/homoserine/homoserine lactone efflux protein
MTLAGFLAYGGALALAAAIPGPGITALVARALGSGFRSSLAMSLGLIVGDLTYLTAVVLGLALVAQTFGMVFLVVKWLGVEARKGRGGYVSAFLSGLAVTLGNPKVMIFYLALTPTLVDLRTVTLADYGVLAAVTVAVLLIVLVPYLALAAKARWFLRTPRALKALNRTAAAFMGGAALAIAARQ